MWGFHGMFLILPFLFNTSLLLYGFPAFDDVDAYDTNPYETHKDAYYSNTQRPHQSSNDTSYLNGTQVYQYQDQFSGADSFMTQDYPSNEGTGVADDYNYVQSAFSDWEIYHVDMDLVSSDWSLLYSSICGMSCQNGSLVVRYQCSKPKCYPCECDQSCVSRGTCCPSFYNIEDEDSPWGTNKSQYVNGTFSNDGVFERARCQWVQFEENILVVSNCPRHWSDWKTRQRCEHPSYETLDSLTYYLDLETGLVFRNIHCIVCNGLNPYSNASYHSLIDVNTHAPRGQYSERFKSLEYSVSCENYNKIYNVTNRVDYLMAAMTFCDVSLKDTNNTIKCPRADVDLIYPRKDACPADSHGIMRDLCHNLPSFPALRVAGSRNVFCHLCHGSEIRTTPFACQYDSGFNPFAPPTTLLFSSAPRTVDEGSAGTLDICVPGQRANTTGQCLQVFCPAGKLIVNGSECQTPVEEIRGLRYTFRMTCVSTTKIPKRLQDRFVESLIGILTRGVSWHRFDYWMRKSTRLYGDKRMEYETQIELLGLIYTMNSVSRDETENQAVDALFGQPLDVPIVDDDGSALNVSLHIVCAGQEMCNVYHEQSQFEICVAFEAGYKHNMFMGSSAIELSPILSCPYVTLNLMEHLVFVGGRVKLTIDLNDQQSYVTWDPSGMLYEADPIHMCVQMYRNIQTLLEKGDTTQGTLYYVIMVHYYLDTVCIFVSCALLLVSIVTYLIFPSLRSLPGLNTLCLCLCLLTAQLALLITSLFGTRGFLPETYCLVHGIVLHYSWVASFIWMNACCIHTYRVFTGIKIKYSLSNFTWYCVYSFGLPVLVVVLVTLITALTTGGKSIGYDRHTCFLDTTTSSLILIMGLLAPLLFSVMSNGVLFTLTIKTIVSMTRMREQPKSSHGVFTYVKLSTVTGFFCLFTATAIQFNNPILSLVATPFAALQGVVIFVSFIANKRVFKLYADLLSNKTQNPSTSSHSEVSEQTQF